MSLPTFTVITPSFNQGKFIEKTITSVLSQSHKPVEYLVFDGGSNDETIDVLKKWDNYLSWTSEDDDGQAAAVNKGLECSIGEIIGWINSDDTYNEDALKNVAIAFNNHPELDVIYGRAIHIDENDGAIDEYRTAYWDGNLLLHQCFICQPALFFRRRILLTTGLLDETLNFCMDYEFWIRLSRSGCRFGYLDQILANSRLYKENKTLFNRQAVHKEIIEMLKRETGWVSIHWIKAYSSTITRNRTKNKNMLVYAYKLVKLIIQMQWQYNNNIGISNMLSLLIARSYQQCIRGSVLKASR